jgi:hypothetical protein
LRFAVCGLRFAVCGLRFAVCGLRFAVCGLRLLFEARRLLHTQKRLSQALPGITSFVLHAYPCLHLCSISLLLNCHFHCNLRSLSALLLYAIYSPFLSISICSSSTHSIYFPLHAPLTSPSTATLLYLLFHPPHYLIHQQANPRS